MNIIGLEEIVFGVEDIAGCSQYLRDYGLAPVGAGDAGGRFEAADGTAVVLRRADDPALPVPMATVPAPFPKVAPMLRETVYGVSDVATLEAIATEMSDRPVRRGADGSVHVVDDMGFAIAFKLSQRRLLTPAPLPIINEPAIGYDMTIVPQTLSHIVYFVPDAAVAEAFYARLGFITTDRFTGVGPFMRCPAQTDHHALFFIQTPPFMKGVEHFTFHFESGTHVLHAGTQFAARGYQSFWGPGRHIFGSNWFWYFNSPFGCTMEFDADMDQHDDNWAAREAPMTADNAQLFLFEPKPKWVPGGPPGKGGSPE